MNVEDEKTTCQDLKIVQRSEGIFLDKHERRQRRKENKSIGIEQLEDSDGSCDIRKIFVELKQRKKRSTMKISRAKLNTNLVGGHSQSTEQFVSFDKTQIEVSPEQITIECVLLRIVQLFSSGFTRSKSLRIQPGVLRKHVRQRVL